MELKLLSGNGFHIKDHCDTDLWPTDFKNNSVCLSQGNNPMKFQDCQTIKLEFLNRKSIHI